MDYENLTPQYRIEEYLEAIVEGWVDATVVAYPEVPSWRIEEFLDAFITYIWEDGDHPRKPCPEPAWRLEECLRAIYDVMTGAATPWAFPTPTNRIEEYLAAIHAYLADGTELPVPEPVWRIEQWLAYVLAAVKQGGGVEKTVSGTMVHITDALAKAALSVLASIEPIQSLHGYSSPWPAGGGVNKFAIGDAVGVLNSIGATYGLTITLDATNETVRITGTPTWSNSAASVSFRIISCRSGSSFGDAPVTHDYTGMVAKPFVVSKSSNISAVSDIYVNADGTLGVLLTKTDNAAVDITLRIAIEVSGSTITAWSPYSNICPISGRTGLSVFVGPTTAQADATTYSVDWTTQAGTVYGGTLDVVTGVLTVDRANIASYNGEVINEPWLSSMDEYAPGATPTTGAQVVYKLATPLTYQLTAQEVEMLLGENNVWSSSGDTVSVTYYAEGNANPLQSLNILLGGNYSNPKTADDVSDKEALEIILGGNK